MASGLNCFVATGQLASALFTLMQHSIISVLHGKLAEYSCKNTLVRFNNCKAAL